MKSVLPIKAKPRVQHVVNSKAASLWPKFSAPSTLVEVGVKSLKNKSWRNFSETVLYQSNFKLINSSKSTKRASSQKKEHQVEHKASKSWPPSSLLKANQAQSKRQIASSRLCSTSYSSRPLLTPIQIRLNHKNYLYNRMTTPWKALASHGTTRTTRSPWLAGASRKRRATGSGSCATLTRQSGASMATSTWGEAPMTSELNLMSSRWMLDCAARAAQIHVW